MQDKMAWTQNVLRKINLLGLIVNFLDAVIDKGASRPHNRNTIPNAEAKLAHQLRVRIIPRILSEE